MPTFPLTPVNLPSRRLSGAFAEGLQLPGGSCVEGPPLSVGALPTSVRPPTIMFSIPVPRTSFLDSRFRLRGRVNRLLERGQSVSDTQLDPVAHIGRPGAPLTARPEVSDADRNREA